MWTCGRGSYRSRPGCWPLKIAYQKCGSWCASTACWSLPRTACPKTPCGCASSSAAPRPSPRKSRRSSDGRRRYNRGMARIVIVGAGITGLALAFRLRQARPDFAVTLLESEPRPGGKIWTERRDGFQVEIGPNGFLDTKPATRQLCRHLGLDG